MPPLFPRLSSRDRQPEVMDQPDLPAADHQRALAALRRINALSRTSADLWNPLAKRLRQEPRRVWRLLDVACGGGDVALAFAARAQRAGYHLSVAGCDFSETALTHARGRAAELGVAATFFQRDVLADGLPAGYDAITCTLFLHHLDQADGVALLRAIGAAAGTVGLVSDLRRTRLGYAMSLAACYGLTRSPVVHVDGPLSVRAALCLEEAAQMAQTAGLAGRFKLRKTWPQRFLMTIEGENSAQHATAGRYAH